MHAYGQAVSQNLDTQLIKTIPGVGAYTALVIASEIDGIERFVSSKKVLVQVMAQLCA